MRKETLVKIDGFRIIAARLLLVAALGAVVKGAYDLYDHSPRHHLPETPQTETTGLTTIYGTATMLDMNLDGIADGVQIRMKGKPPIDYLIPQPWWRTDFTGRFPDHYYNEPDGSNSIRGNTRNSEFVSVEVVDQKFIDAYLSRITQASQERKK